MKKILIVTVIFFTTFGNTYGYISKINFLNIFEIEFKNDKNNVNNKQNIDLNKDKITNIAKEVETEEIVNNAPIQDIQFVNNKMYIYLDLDFNFSSFYFYINGFKINDFGKGNFEKERFYGTEKQKVYSYDERFYESKLFSGKNYIYFKSKNTGENTIKYSFYNGEFVDYDVLKNKFICKGNIDKYIVYNGYGEKIIEKDGRMKNEMFFSTKTGNTKLKKGFYKSYLYCKDDFKDIYYIYNFSFQYSSMYELLINKTGYGKYYSRNEYYSKLKNSN